MNLNEALKILKENNYLTEFLNTSVSLDQLVKLMVKNNIISDNVIIEHDCDAICVQNVEEDLTSDDVYNFSKKCEKFIDRLAGFVRKYGWEFIHTSFSKADILNFNEETNKVEIVLYNRSRDTHDYGNEFYHSTTLTKEEIIDSNKGLRVKTRFSEITEPKIYLLSAKLINMNHPRVKSMYTGDTTLKKVLSYYADHDFGDNLYKITLPKNYIVKKDAEHSDMSQNSPEVYVTQNIPAKYITYVGSINDMLFSESLKISKEHNYLTETLSPKYTDLWNVFKQLNLKYGMKPEYVDTWEENVGELYIDISNITDSKDNNEGEIESCALYSVTTQVIDATDEQIEEFLNKHSYHLRFASTLNKKTAEITYYVEAINTDVIYPQEGEVFSHMSEASPDKILKTGLRCRGSSHKNTQWKKFENWYGDRIYLTKITPDFERRLDHLAAEAEQAKEEWYDQENPDPIDKPDIKKLYCYEIKLPKTFPLHQDPEYGKNRYYVNQNIPPKFIKYTSWIEILA